MGPEDRAPGRRGSSGAVLRRDGGRALPSKTRWAGVERRRELLEGVGIVLKSDLGEAGEKARVDDVLDAAAAAWTARRVAEGRARCIPESPQSFSDGLTCAIWV